MKVTSIFRCVVLVALLSWIGCAGVRAQILTASVSTTNAIGINQFLIYTMNVNTTSTPSITVNDTLSGAPVAIVSFTASSSTFAQVLTTNLPTVSAAVSFGASNVLLTLTVQATSAGTLNSSIISTDPSGIPLTATNFVNVITNGSVPVPPTNTTTADLAVSIVGPGLPVITNDYAPFRLTVANMGSGAASDVLLTAGFTNASSSTIMLVDPAHLITVTSNQLQFPFGTLGGGAVTNVYFILQPTNVDLFTFFAAVGSSTLDSDTNNNLAMTNITVTNYLSGDVAASNVTEMTPNFQTGLMEQTVRLTNLATNDLASARLVIHGLTNWLYNAAGTNNGEPFVYFPATLGTNQSADLHLEYFIPSLTPVTVSNSAFEVPPVSLTPPPGTPFAITLQTNLPSGAVLVEFPSILNRTYTVLYADNIAFSNELTALSLIVAPADRVQWIDAGPPQTISAPTNVASRFYRVLLNP